LAPLGEKGVFPSRLANHSNRHTYGRRCLILRRAVAAAACFAAAASASAQVTPSVANPVEPVAIDAFVTFGARFTQRTLVESAAPIEIIQVCEIWHGRSTEVAKIL
jgi:hypothetical protein